MKRKRKVRIKSGEPQTNLIKLFLVAILASPPILSNIFKDHIVVKCIFNLRWIPLIWIWTWHKETIWGRVRQSKKVLQSTVLVNVCGTKLGIMNNKNLIFIKTNNNNLFFVPKRDCLLFLCLFVLFFFVVFNTTCIHPSSHPHQQHHHQTLPKVFSFILVWKF